MSQVTNWYTELITPELTVSYAVRQVVYSSRTKFQQVDILDTVVFGRALVLDNKTQSTEADEHLYHESLVHPVMLMHSGPKTVFIGGGGEGATLREVLSHQSVERIVMVDIDEEVVELCKRFLPRHHQGSFDDPRTRLHYANAREYLNNTSERYDVMILDLADPIEAGPAYKLYTKEFYQLVRQRLNSGGFFVTQSGPAGPLNCSECFTSIVHTLNAVFTHTKPYSLYVPSFGGEWGFTVASDVKLPRLSIKQIDARLVRCLNKPLTFYDGVTHQRLFMLPKYLRDGLVQSPRLITDASPLFVI
jgi:spermidine synthase